MASRAERQPDYVEHGTKASGLFLELIGSVNDSVLSESWRKKNWLFGWLSGYPECCIDFYCDAWAPAWHVLGINGAHEKFPHMKDARGHRIGYVMCPSCFAKAFPPGVTQAV